MSGDAGLQFAFSAGRWDCRVCARQKSQRARWTD